MKKKKLITGWVLILGIAFLFGCYPGGPETTSQYNIILTRYDKAYDFGSKKTYFLIDTIAYITNIDDPDVSDEELEEWEDAVFSSIKENMNARGYTQETDTSKVDEVDLVILSSTIGILNSGYVWMPPPGWWGGYYYPGYPGWGPGWGWWYPPGWGGGYPISYSYTTGTVVILMADQETAGDGDLENLVALEWKAVIDGLFSGVVNASTIDQKIDQAFTQSPYIQSK